MNMDNDSNDEESNRPTSFQGHPCFSQYRTTSQTTNSTSTELIKNSIRVIDKGNEYDINYEGNNSHCLLIKKTL